jgi:hypothetical protein
MKPALSIFGVIVAVCLQGCGGSMIKHSAKDSGESFIADSSRRAPDPVLSAGYPTAKSTPGTVVKTEKDLNGYWVGKFEPDTAREPLAAGDRDVWDYANLINVSIDAITGDKVVGHSVVAGNDRPFSGGLQKVGSTYKFVVKEPGNDKYDGTFQFTIAEGDSIVRGTWKATGNIKIASRKYELTKRVFSYNPGNKLGYRRFVDWDKKQKVTASDAGDDNTYTDTAYYMTTEDLYKYNPSTDVLTQDQVSNLKKPDIFILRNSIFARHGYSFKKQPLRVFFDHQPWYIPVSTDVRNFLTPLEKKNLELLLRYEKHASAYYDTFGR